MSVAVSFISGGGQGGGIKLSQHVMVDAKSDAATLEKEALDNLRMLLPDLPALAVRPLPSAPARRPERRDAGVRGAGWTESVMEGGFMQQGRRAQQGGRGS